MNKVLIIDDDTFLTELYSRLMQSEGLDVEVANSGAEALALLSTSQPDLIVLDLHMPGMHGTEVLSAIRNNARLQHIPVIIFATGYMKSMISQVGDLGVHKVFSKMKCKPRVLLAEIKDSFANLEEKAVSQTFETRSALEVGIVDMQDPGKDQLRIWIERLGTDERPDARRVCLLYLYRMMREDIFFAMGLGELTPEGKLGCALKKLLEDLYDTPQLIHDSTVESLQHALDKLLSLNDTKRSAKLESEELLRDVLKGL